MSLKTIGAIVKTRKFLIAAAAAVFVTAIVVIQKTVPTDIEFDAIEFEVTDSE
jgi:hypothetical protein